MDASQPLTQALLDRAMCEHDDCDHLNHDSVLVIRQRCCEDAALIATYDKETGLLTLSCSSCHEAIGDIKVAAT